MYFVFGAYDFGHRKGREKHARARLKPFVPIDPTDTPERGLEYMYGWFGTTQAHVFEHQMLLLKETAAPLEAGTNHRN